MSSKSVSDKQRTTKSILLYPHNNKLHLNSSSSSSSSSSSLLLKPNFIKNFLSFITFMIALQQVSSWKSFSMLFLVDKSRILRLPSCRNNRPLQRLFCASSKQQQEKQSPGEMGDNEIVQNTDSNNNNRNDDNIYQIRLNIPTVEDMEELGAVLSCVVAASKPELILLDGDLGAGKTSFARGFLQCITGDDNLRVTSPTYLLSNSYYSGLSNDVVQHEPTEIHHMDLYRLSGNNPKELHALNLDHVFSNCICLMEWSSRIFQSPFVKPKEHSSSSSILLPRECLGLSIRIQENEDRLVTIQTFRDVKWFDRLEHLIMDEILDDWLLENIE